MPQSRPHARARCSGRAGLGVQGAQSRPGPALTLELVEADGGLVGINTIHPNRLVEEAIGAGRIAELEDYEVIRREVRYDERCRIDLLLHHSGRPDCFVEVKNVHLKRTAGAEFPDAVTVRGAKHLGALARQVAAGARAVVVYVVQRTDCADFRIAADIDPVYAAGFRAALDAGVEGVLCLRRQPGRCEAGEALPILPD